LGKKILKLGWKPKTTLKDLISEMVEADSRIAKFEYEVKFVTLLLVTSTCSEFIN
jgi:hypothetical protein